MIINLLTTKNKIQETRDKGNSVASDKHPMFKYAIP